MYTFTTRVRYSECGAGQQARLSGILDYLQDICTFQAEDLNIGLEYMEKHHVAWVLSYWQVDIERYPVLGENIKISTWPYEFQGFLGYRNFKIEDEAGNMIVRANSVWVFMDTERGRPMRILPEIVSAYNKERRLEMEYLGRKVSDFDAEMPGAAFAVPKYFIDTNHHVNNAKYIQLAEELLPPGFVAARIRAEYCKPALYGDVLYPSALRTTDKLAVKVNDDNGKPYVVIEFYSAHGNCPNPGQPCIYTHER